MNESPALQLEARANRAAGRYAKARDELHMIHGIIRCSELPADVKIRLFAALTVENTFITGELERIESMRKAAQISRGRQWVTSGDG